MRTYSTAWGATAAAVVRLIAVAGCMLLSALSCNAAPIAGDAAVAPGAAAKISAKVQVKEAAASAVWVEGKPMTPEAARLIVSKVALQRDERDGSAAQLLSQDVLKKFTPTLRKQIQRALLEIYAEDPAYLLAYRESTTPLSDNIVGPITLSWLNRFWFEFKMEPSGNLTNASVAALLHFAATVKAHPEWKADLISSDLGRWIDGFDSEDRARYYQIRQAGTDEQIIAMLRLYHYETDNSRQPPPDPDRALLTIYSYSLTANDFKLLTSKSQVIAKLSGLQDMVYLNEPLFDAAVLDALKDLGRQAESYLPAARLAAHEQSYRLTLGSLQLLRDGNTVPDSVINELEKLSGTYPNEAFFTEAILDATAKLNEPIDQYTPEIVKVAETSTSYILTARALTELNVNRKNEPVPPVILDMLKGLKGLDYPQQWLFDKAVMARFRDGIGACPSGTPGNTSYRRKLSDAQMMQLEAALKDANLFGKLDKLWQDKACGPSDLLVMPQQIEALYVKYRASIRETARKKPAYDPNKRVLWDGAGCGCVLDQLDGEVYGFYPFWLAGSRQKVDFSTLSRIAYYGPTFDDSGVLRQANDGRDFVAAMESGDLTQNDFINIAQRHQTAVDWVIQRNDWRSWIKMDKDRKELVFQRLTTNIVKLMSIKLNNWSATLSSHLPFGDRFVPTNGEGVTLFFDGYPDDEVSVGVFNRFVDTLRTRLREARVGDGINVMMRHTALGNGVYDYANLYNLIAAADANRSVDFLRAVERGHDRRPHFLVLLEEETSDSKKQLRLRMENSLHGGQRMTVLRQVVPVITFNNDNWQQLQDDIIYFKDNFGGIGFWPMSMTLPPAAGEKTAPTDAVLPTTTGVQQCDITRDISQCITDFYQYVPGAQASLVCKTVCENLYAFRLATKLAFMLLIGCAALYYWSCLWRETMARYHHAPALIVAAVWILLVMALLFCDPFLRWLARGYMIPIFLVLFIIGLISWYQYLLKARDEQP
ncbi:hypothetical protein SAMN04515620_11119 [Collimonas sp. OK607]|uniref:hypothetical protein n=1 Tax=Collimonas sp. OK607 TaxID=1798194 RepID=UPI0008E12803|nr:hypothetical protein [Collimonas sp. OK607]SFA98781.1 hypothetical protein SAMN04515620_11119 [Collimonas sp. OK607]